jgi:hypothetical protein
MNRLDSLDTTATKGALTPKQFRIIDKESKKVLDNKINNWHNFRKDFWFQERKKKLDYDKQTLVIMKPHTDEWIDHLIATTVGDSFSYTHKNTFVCQVMGNWFGAKNKKDMNYDSNSINHIWFNNVTPADAKSKIDTIIGTTVWAVWDFDYLLDAVVYKNKGSSTRIDTKFVTFDLKKDAQAYLKKYLDLAKTELDIQQAFDVMSGYRATGNMILEHKPFKQIHKIEVPDQIDVISFATFIDKMKEYFGPIFKSVMMAKVNQAIEYSIIQNNHYASTPGPFIRTRATAVIREQSKILEVKPKNRYSMRLEDFIQWEVLPVSQSMNRLKKKIIQNNIAQFKIIINKEKEDSVKPRL